MYTTLITAEELARHIDDPDWVVVDCRFDLANPMASVTLASSHGAMAAIFAQQSMLV